MPRGNRHGLRCYAPAAFSGHYAGGIGSLALSYLFGQEARADAPAPETTHHPAKARAVICLFQHGGPSQMDLFDPKPELTRRHGQRYSGQLETHFHTQTGNILGSPFRFQRHGQAGIDLSELLPHLGGISDEITLVRSMPVNQIPSIHEAALRLIHKC